jgi:quercetin dioxygenase-like cupin family protein
MTHTIVPANATRRTETPNAVMTTLASPSLSGTTALSLWRVDMAAGISGPLHSFDSEQIWTILSGEATCALDGIPHALHNGDTIRIPADVQRQFTATADTTFLVCGHGDALASTPTSDRPVSPPWIA